MRSTSLDALLLLGTALAPAVSAAESARPRGVGPEFAKFYKDAEKFTCISNPAITLSASQVNDDYCDCPDGSDEPGTAACSYLSPMSPRHASDPNADDPNITVALPGFYCKNKGHLPGYIPFTAVNDGICDYELCCDGSDEWEGVGGLKCEDRCKQIGAEWRKQDEARQKSLAAANQRRKELIAEAGRLRKEVEDRLQTLHTEIEGSEIKVKNLEKEFAEIEQQEKAKLAQRSKKGTGKFSALAAVAKQHVEDLKEALTRVRAERDASRERVAELEQILSTFKEEYNPNFNDEGVKRAVQAWEDYAARDKGPDSDAAHERDIDEYLKPEIADLNWDDFDADESGSDVLYKFEELLPDSIRPWVDEKLRALRQILIDNGIVPEDDSSAAASESQVVKDAKSRLTSAENDLKNQKKELENHESDLTKDYGPDEIFRALKGQCVSVDSGEYTYEFCYMDKTWQKPKKRGGNTNMGNFVRIETIVVDEDVGPDGKGLGSGERIALKYENGQNCWNGPNRSTTVILACAEKDEIWKVREEEKCVYRMEVGSPAVCTPAQKQKKSEEQPRDEL
ncbi:Mannose-6-phosphate receptor binding protein [Lasiodiplodia theobromae]|uniref:Mannose-6-phosphate receptor binding protein n=1 Tax=Lasiodiplodia theobromae TaxID=45133 RepID=UPI0015C2F428|nr:Mannose-6-phosphate receptor binding protein [Lasiodiplodia theobromae]KAF4546709.1 Mannose-6-phosphate receptor binding protein [Lasiodiplodia theobromae]KAF9632116.1 Mannose-6-phosphate receptor binding protein [Lasiodiplodia theobromae]